MFKRNLKPAPEVLATTNSEPQKVVGRPSPPAGLWKPLLGGLILAAAFFVFQASNIATQIPDLPQIPGLAAPQAMACSTGSVSDTDYWVSPTGNTSYSYSRSVTWRSNIVTSWCYTYVFANYDGSSWHYLGTSGDVGTGWISVMTITAGSDGYANGVIGASLHFRSCTSVSGGQPAGTCSSGAAGSMDNNLIIDAQAPGAPTVTYPTSTWYTNAGSGTVTWAKPSVGPSDISAYYVNYHWATPNADGGCVGQGDDSGWQWVGNTTSWGPVWGANTCFQFQVYAISNAGVGGSAGGWSAWILMDNQIPTVGGHLNATCFLPGQTVTLIDGGSSDPWPGSGWPWGGGMWYYYNNGSSASGWTSASSYSYTVPTPGAGTQGNYQGQMYIRDFVGYALNNGTNQSNPLGLNYSVDNTYPSLPGYGTFGNPVYTTSAAITFNPFAWAGGCAGVNQVAFSNDGSHWLYGQTNGAQASWDVTNAAYGGNTNQGVKTIYVSFNEGGGSNWTQTTLTTIYDYTAPTGSLNINSGATYTAAADVTLNPSATDTGGSNLTSMRFSNDNSNWGGWVSYATSYTYTLPAGDGSKTVYVQYKDNAGTTSGSYSRAIILDTAAPTLSFGCAGTPGPGYANNTCGSSNWFVASPVTVTFSGADAISGLASLAYQIDGDAIVNLLSPPNSTSFTVSGDGKHPISLCVKDVADNQTCTGSFVYIDSTSAPVIYSITPSAPDGLANWYVTDPAISLTTTDATSGFSDPLWLTDNLAGLYYQIDGSPPQKTTSLTDTITTSFNLFDGDHTIVYWTIDAAHNTSSETSVTIKVDTIRPQSHFSANAGSLNADHLTTIPVSLSSSDAGSGTANSVVRFSTDGGLTWGDWLPLAADGSYIGTIAFPNGANTVSLFALEEQVRDNAGNLGIPRTGPSPTGELDVPPNLSVIFAVSPVSVSRVDNVVAVVCSQTVYLTKTNKVTWPTEQSFCLAPQIGSLANPVGTHDNGALIGVPWTGDGDAITQYSFVLADNPYLSNPTTDENGQVHFTPKAETTAGGVTVPVTVTVTLTANVAFWLPSQLDNNGTPKNGEIPQKITPMEFTVTGNIIILNSGTVTQQ